jgi:uncharacterized protein YneF (UPF0154 family)
MVFVIYFVGLFVGVILGLFIAAYEMARCFRTGKLFGGKFHIII